MASRVDLHTHTTASDGTLSPSQLFDKAAELGIDVLAVTDHDSTAGYQALRAIRDRHPDVELIPGIEVSAEGEWPCHLLGYFVSPEADGFQEELAQYRRWRQSRMAAMVRKLNALGVVVEMERVLAIAAGGTVGRPHLADAMIEKGYVKTRQQAFDRFLKRDGPAFVPGDGPRAPECIQLIRSAGGIPVLAHPSYYTSPDLLQKLVGAGLMGIEVYYPEHSRSLIQRYLDLAKTYQLVATGGSDFHGPRTGRPSMGSVAVPETVIQNLEQAKARL